MINLINLIIQACANAVLAILNLLPQTPFNWDLGALGEYWGYVNYFIPFASMATIMTGFLSATLVWYGVRWVLRFVKYID